MATCPSPGYVLLSLHLIVRSNRCGLSKQFDPCSGMCLLLCLKLLVLSSGPLCLINTSNSDAAKQRLSCLVLLLRKRLPGLDPCSLTPELPMCYSPHLVNFSSAELPISSTPHLLNSPPPELTHLLNSPSCELSIS